MNTELNTEPVDTVRVIKTASCPSLSDRSTLTYKIGCNPDIQFRVCGNTGGGFYNDEWVPLSAIQKVINKMPKGVAVTSSTFSSIFAGKSNNTSGFLLAVMKHVGLAKPLTGSLRGYEFLDTTEFVAAMDVLIAALPEVVMAEEINAPVSKKLAIKSKAIPT
jgi:hypothetical protein